MCISPNCHCVESFYLFSCSTGEKTFTLFPPSDVAFLPVKKVRTCAYRLKSQRDLSCANDNGPRRYLSSDLELDPSNVSTGTFLALKRLLLNIHDHLALNSIGNSKNCCKANNLSVQWRYIIMCEVCMKISFVDPDFPWIGIDPDEITTEESFPLSEHSSPVRCHVNAGEILYIPSMWYHRVSLTKLTIAIEYWYEQDFNFR